MRTIRRKYKTFEGFYRAYGSQLTVDFFFGYRTWYDKGKLIKAELPQEEITRIAEKVAKYIYPSIWKERAWALAVGRGDLSYFHYFYIEIWKNEICISNSLSGDAFESCKRKYSRSI